MEIQSILDAIDAEIAQLQKARSLLADSSEGGKVGGKSKKRTRRKLSKEARARIAEAQRKRWAAAKRAAK